MNSRSRRTIAGAAARSRFAVALVLIVLAAALAVAVAANALVRPGCSLLPVALPDEPFRNHPATLEQACAALGRPLPQPRILPDGVELSAVRVDGPPPMGLQRFVTVSYAKSGRGIAMLRVVPGNGIPAGNLGEVNGTVAGMPAIIKQSHLTAINADDVTYLWARDGLLFTLHVQLAPGITREMGDAMAKSVR